MWRRRRIALEATTTTADQRTDNVAKHFWRRPKTDRPFSFHFLIGRSRILLLLSFCFLPVKRRGFSFRKYCRAFYRERERWSAPSIPPNKRPVLHAKSSLMQSRPLLVTQTEARTIPPLPSFYYLISLVRALSQPLRDWPVGFFFFFPFIFVVWGGES